jgi:hypothetical protein
MGEAVNLVFTKQRGKLIVINQFVEGGAKLDDLAGGVASHVDSIRGVSDTQNKRKAIIPLKIIAIRYRMWGSTDTGTCGRGSTLREVATGLDDTSSAGVALEFASGSILGHVCCMRLDAVY